MTITTNNSIRVRFAPSPTGHLHLGSARTALYNWLFVRHKSGTFIVRIEDTDFVRSRPEYEQSILNDIKWLGLEYDEGPGKGAYGPYRQSRRLALYRNKANQLVKEDKAYFCFCSPRSEAEEEKRECKCFNFSRRDVIDLQTKGKKAAAIRFKVPQEKISFDDLIYGKTEFDAVNIKDFIILRSNGLPTFHLSVVVDDGEMKITHVIRGNDHLPNTPKHILLFKALGYPLPQFAHHSLILGKDGAKLSKRHGATAVFEYRERGYLPKAIINYLALLSWSPAGEEEIFSPDELAKYFDLKKLSRSPAIFDLDKLNWINGQHIRSYNLKKLTRLVVPFLKKEDVRMVDFDWLTKMVEATRDDYVTLVDAPKQAKLFFGSLKMTSEAKQWLKKPGSGVVLTKLEQLLKKADLGKYQGAKELLQTLSQEMKKEGIKGKDVFMPVRAALTGKTSGPELFYILTLFGKEKCLERMPFLR